MLQAPEPKKDKDKKKAPLLSVSASFAQLLATQKSVGDGAAAAAPSKQAAKDEAPATGARVAVIQDRPLSRQESRFNLGPALPRHSLSHNSSPSGSGSSSSSSSPALSPHQSPQGRAVPLPARLSPMQSHAAAAGQKQSPLLQSFSLPRRASFILGNASPVLNSVVGSGLNAGGLNLDDFKEGVGSMVQLRPAGLPSAEDLLEQADSGPSCPQRSPRS